MVHAGLDILLGELRVLQSICNTTILELVEDIFSASESAISILNDLLEYEHLDAGEWLFPLHYFFFTSSCIGSFQLDLGWKPLLHLMDGKLKWATFMAKRKGISFGILDHLAAEAIETTEHNTVDYNASFNGCHPRLFVNIKCC